MPQVFYAPIDERNQDFAPDQADNPNFGRFPLGHTLITPDKREYVFALNDATVEIAGNLYTAVAPVSNHTNVVADVARAIDAIVISATLGGTAALVDIYAEGVAHTNDNVGEGYAYRIKRAVTGGAAHLAAATSSILTVNLEAGEQVQVALTTASDITFTRNRYHQVLLSAISTVSNVAGVSPGVSAANRFYWSQVKGYAAVAADLTLLAGQSVMPSIAAVGQVESFKRRLQIVTTGSVLTAAFSINGQIVDQDGTAIGVAVGLSVSTATVFDITGGTLNNGPVIGVCVKANASTEFALIDLQIP